MLGVNMNVAGASWRTNELIENAVSREEGTEKTTSCIWSATDHLSFFDYSKLYLLGGGGQKKCWKIESKDKGGDFVLLEYHYPSSAQDEMFYEYEKHERQDAYHEVHEVAAQNANREIDILKRLRNCTGVLQLQRVLQTTKKNGQPIKTNAIVEFKNCGNLRDFSERNTHLDSRKKLSLCISLIQGLISVSEANIYLADIKPENILLDEASGWLTACLCDFCNAVILDNYTAEYKKHNFESMLNIIRRYIYSNEACSYFEEAVQYELDNSDVCLPSLLKRLVDVLK